MLQFTLIIIDFTISGRISCNSSSISRIQKAKHERHVAIHTYHHRFHNFRKDLMQVIIEFTNSESKTRMTCCKSCLSSWISRFQEGFHVIHHRFHEFWMQNTNDMLLFTLIIIEITISGRISRKFTIKSRVPDRISRMSCCKSAVQNCFATRLQFQLWMMNLPG